MELAEPPALPAFRYRVKSIAGKMHFKNLKKKNPPRKAVGLRELKGAWQKIREVWKEKRKSLIVVLDVKLSPTDILSKGDSCHWF